MRWRAERVGLALLLAQLWWASPALADSDSDSDARAVYCTREENHASLVEAAIHLHIGSKGHDGRLKTPGGELTIEEWRRLRGGEFDRACAALIAAGKFPKPPGPASSSGGVSGALIGLIPIAAGAVLALFSTLFTGRRAASQHFSNELFEAASTYHDACHACLDAWKADRDANKRQEEMEPPFQRLRAVLQRNQRRHPQWKYIAQTTQSVKELDQQIKDNRKNEIEASRESLDSIYDDLLTIASALERPLRYALKVRRP